jgi:Ca2+-dependent lipid-binding protein
VILTLFGVHGESIKFRSKVVDDNGFNPVWDETFEFELRERDLAMLCLQVWDSDYDPDDFIARYLCCVSWTLK